MLPFGLDGSEGSLGADADHLTLEPSHAIEDDSHELLGRRLTVVAVGAEHGGPDLGERLLSEQGYERVTGKAVTLRDEEVSSPSLNQGASGGEQAGALVHWSAT
jgi:hypothetical protein